MKHNTGRNPSPRRKKRLSKGPGGLTFGQAQNKYGALAKRRGGGNAKQ